MAFVLVKNADGQTVPVSEEDLPDAIMAGAELLPEPAVDRWGGRTTTASTDAAGVIDPFQEGLVQQQEAYQESFADEDIQAFVEGSLRGLTAGLYQGEDDYETRTSANPVASSAGEITGMVGGALAVPFSAPGLAARAGSVAARGLTGPVARLAVEGAVDGFTYSMMRESAEAMIYDKPFSAESIAAETLAGGGIGGAIGAAAKGAGALSKALSKQDIAAETIARTVAKSDAGIPTGAVGDVAAAGDAVKLDHRPKITDASDVPSVKTAKKFFESDHMKQVDRISKSTWSDIHSLEDDLMRIASESPDFHRAEILPKWRELQRAKRKFGREMGWIEREVKGSPVTGKTLEARFDPPDDFWSGKLSAASIQDNAKLIDDYEHILDLADELEVRFSSVREVGDRWMYGPNTRNLSTKLRSSTGAPESFSSKYLRQTEGATRTADDELLSSIAARRSPSPPVGKTTSMTVKVDDVLAMKPDEAKEFLAKADQGTIDDLAAQMDASPEIEKFTPTSTPFRGRTELGAEFADVIRQASADVKPRRSFARDGGMQSPASPADSVAGMVPSSGRSIVDMLRKTNMLGLVMAANFPGVMLAKEIITRYGDKIAGAASAALSKKVTRLVPTKAVQLGFSKMLAPGGDDRTRDIRAVLKASESPEALDAAIDAAMADIAGDSPGKRAEARQIIARQFQWILGQVPRSLSRFSKDYSPSDVSRFSLIAQAWASPLKVLSQGSGIPMVQLDAVEALWPEMYSHFMISLTEQVAEYAAKNKPIPQRLSRIMPGLSMAATPEGQTILASMRPDDKVKPGGGESANAENIEPTTAVQSISQNRITMNQAR